MTTPLFDFSPEAVAALARVDAARALQEDVGDSLQHGDLTAGLIDPARQCRARVLARESAVICGSPWAQAAVQWLCPEMQIHWLVSEGTRCAPDQVVPLPVGSVDAEGLRIEVESPGRGYEPWFRVDDLAAIST